MEENRVSIFYSAASDEITPSGTFYLGAYWMMWEDEKAVRSIQFKEEMEGEGWLGMIRGDGWMGVDLIHVKKRSNASK
jgi:hypothetical protein